MLISEVVIQLLYYFIFIIETTWLEGTLENFFSNPKAVVRNCNL